MLQAMLKYASSGVAIALYSFTAGVLVTLWCTHNTVVRADSDRAFELMVYHAKPGKAGELETVFRQVSKLQAKHHLDAIGYWLPESKAAAWKDTFVYLIAHPSKEAAKQNWDELHADPEFPPYRKAAAPLIEQENGNYRVDEVLMRSSSYSRLR